MLSKFFLNSPIFAWVIAMMIMVAGLLAIKHCPSPNIRLSPRLDQNKRRVSRGFGGDSGETRDPDRRAAD